MLQEKISIGEGTLAEKRVLACPSPRMPSEATETVGTNHAEADRMGQTRCRREKMP